MWSEEHESLYKSLEEKRNCSRTLWEEEELLIAARDEIVRAQAAEARLTAENAALREWSKAMDEYFSWPEIFNRIPIFVIGRLDELKRKAGIK